MRLKNPKSIVLTVALGLMLVACFLWVGCGKRWTKPLAVNVIETRNKADEKKGADWYLYLRITNSTGERLKVKPTDFAVVDESVSKYSYIGPKGKPGPVLSASLESDQRLEGWLTFHLPFGSRPVKLIYRCSLDGKKYSYKIYP